MLYRPEEELLWDTWLVSDEGSYYLFYIRLSTSRSPSSPKPSLGDGWDGISLARSADLLHWEEMGPIFEMHPDAAWLGTGMVFRRGDRFVMTFCEERPVGCPVISFAESRNLLEWNRLPNDYDLRPDPRFYQVEQSESADPLPRWGDLSVAPPSNGQQHYLGFAVANARETLPGHCGTLGLLISDDGLTWEAQPPAIAPGIYPSYEVPEHVALGERHYILFSTNSTAGPRFDTRATGPHSGTYYVVSDCATGPYVKPPHDNLLLGQRDTPRLFGTYVGRPLRISDHEVLLYHQWTAKIPDGWWGPPKLLVERGPYQLGVDYWPGCDGLKAKLLARGVRGGQWKPLKAAGRVPVIEWADDGETIHAVNRGGTHGIVWQVPAGELSRSNTDLSDGRVLEMGMRIREGRGLGLWIGRGAQARACGLLVNAASGAVEFGSFFFTKDGASWLFQPDERAEWPVVLGARHQVRVIFRRQFLELYIDGRFVHAYISADLFEPADLGFFAELAAGDFVAPAVWSMA
ncbi:MAG: hypothetical protein KBH93_00355 [Anaerolineae bacterium]|nr:hypothetical protein [Anaerolineae bacterium]